MTRPTHFPPFPPPGVPYQDSPQAWQSNTPGDNLPFPTPDTYQAWRASASTRHSNAGGPSGFRPPDDRMTEGGFKYWRQDDESRPSSTPGSGQQRTYHSGRDSARSSRPSSPSHPSHSAHNMPGYISAQGGYSSASAPTRGFASEPSRPNRLPTGTSAYIPPHFRHSGSPAVSQPVREFSSEPSRRVISETSRHYDRAGTPSETTPVVVSLPSDHYIELSKEPIWSKKGKETSENTVTPKLLILDLNGALIYRNKSKGPFRKSHARPYLSCFLEYLFSPEVGEGNAEHRQWEVFVWSSAQPHNVRAMVESGFGYKWTEGVWEVEDPERYKERVENGEGRLLGVWARDRMGLSDVEYRNKVQTVKDIAKIHAHVKEELSWGLPAFDERTTVLLDDSPLKGVLQPWNQVVIPEYDKDGYQSSKLAVATEAGDHGMDEILLGVIGILDELKSVENVPAWVRAGHLTPDVDGGLSSGIEVIRISPEGEPPHPTLETLPSHGDFTHWYQIPHVLQHWVSRGRSALDKRGIPLQHGIEPDDTVPASPRPARAWSPSRPAETSPGPRSTSRRPSFQSSRRSFSSEPNRPQALNPRLVDSWSPADPANKWRTFRAFDVSRYLSDVADRLSPLDTQQRDHLLAAIEVLKSLGWEEEDNTLEVEEMRRLGFYDNMCDGCTLAAGEKLRAEQTRTAGKKVLSGRRGKVRRGKKSKIRSNVVPPERAERASPQSISHVEASLVPVDIHNDDHAEVGLDPPMTHKMRSERMRNIRGIMKGITKVNNEAKKSGGSAANIEKRKRLESLLEKAREALAEDDRLLQANGAKTSTKAKPGMKAKAKREKKAAKETKQSTPVSKRKRIIQSDGDGDGDGDGDDQTYEPENVHSQVQGDSSGQRASKRSRRRAEKKEVGIKKEEPIESSD